MRYVLIYFLVFISSFALDLSDKDLNLNIAKGKSLFKEYTLTNNSNIEKEYYLSATDKNIKITPKGFRLKPFENKNFKITVNGNNEDVGTYSYYLEIKEVIRKEAKKNELNVNKLFRIKQKYNITL